ncbi:MAG: hypothetical protein AUK47_15505 [Deltaproteobacteria bacterium CG2_30_63_29]|nr:MAG: hypothetical protein AUK47_15505 [Deltaproteobacteria bacterium CG2_30_63_29]PIV99075.1 MAG: hypothetical protein COW42_12180 [Deltaproteobacteria bacterium CG17_big_fil_post_rev_8_21_14_2_50_63_7]PJB43966.1 MAG: hypothetical protein CO108_09350 [Deltaproteobacteria bacterium CG_4_9_14_3_um_filter_63_12]
MAGPGVEDVKEEQKALQLMIEELNKTSDPEQFNQILAMIEAQAAKLKATAVAAGDAIVASVGGTEGLASPLLEGPRPKVEVLLTPEQRQKVFDETGVNMESVLIKDDTGARTSTMRQTTPPEIEFQAIEQAHEFNRMVEAQKTISQDVADAMAGLEDSDDPRLVEALERAKADPNFLAGLNK